MEVQTLYNHAALEIPEVKAALNKWQEAPSWHAALAMSMSVGAAALIVGTDTDQTIDGFVVVTLPQALTDTLPWVMHFQNDGTRELKNAMIEATLAFVRQAGYNGFRALNQSGLPDRVWLRIFKNGGRPQKMGSTYYFDISEAEDVGRTTNNRRDRRRNPGRTSRRDGRVRPGKRTGRQQKLDDGRVKRKLKPKQPAGRSNAAVVPTVRTNRGRKPR